jgi:hypothetical protein
MHPQGTITGITPFPLKYLKFFPGSELIFCFLFVLDRRSQIADSGFDVNVNESV